MTKIMAVLQWCLLNYKKVILGIITVLTAVVMILKIVPGNQGEDTLQSAIDTLQKIEGSE